MKISLNSMALSLIYLPRAIAWGELGHTTTAYLAGNFVSNSTAGFFKELLGNNDDDYLASISMFADSFKFTKTGSFTRNFHFIDAHDNPPTSCNVDNVRDCKKTGCVISALTNYTEQSLDYSLDPARRALAAKLIVHYVGDLHQPLHNEDVGQGGTQITVKWESVDRNLHAVWDRYILEKITKHLRRGSNELALRWANQLAIEINNGKFAAGKEEWLKHFNLTNPHETAMAWSQEANVLVCSHVFPRGHSPKEIVGKELSDDYYIKVHPAVEEQVARAGFRMAAWLDGIANEFLAGKDSDQTTDEL